MTLPETFVEIPEEKFWERVSVLPPLIRMGFRNHGGFLCSEPWNHRTCTVTNKEEEGAYDATFTLSEEDEEKARYFRVEGPLTVGEFKALCARVIPGTGICSWGYGKDLCPEAA